MSVTAVPDYLSKELISDLFGVEVASDEDKHDVWGFIKGVLDERRRSELPDSGEALVETLETKDVVTDLDNAYEETKVMTEKIVSKNGRRYTHAGQEGQRVNHIGMIVGNHRRTTSLKTQDEPDSRARVNPEPTKSKYKTGRDINLDRIEDKVSEQPQFIVKEDDGIEIIFPNAKVETIQNGELHFERDYAEPVTRQDIVDEVSGELPDLSEMTVEYQGELENATVLYRD